MTNEQEVEARALVAWARTVGDPTVRHGLLGVLNVWIEDVEGGGYSALLHAIPRIRETRAHGELGVDIEEAVRLAMIPRGEL